MSIPDTDPAPPVTASRRPALGALRWGLVCAAWAGVVWPVAVLAASFLLNVTIAPSFLRPDMPWVAAVAAVLGGVYGFLAGVLVLSVRRRRNRGGVAMRTILGSTAIGAVGAGLCVDFILLFQPRLHPLVSSSLAWALVGLLAGLVSYGLPRRAPAPADSDVPDSQAGEYRSVLVALGWALVAAACMAGAWAVGLVVAASVLNATLASVELERRMPGLALLMASAGAGVGLLAGALVGLLRVLRDHGTTALMLGLGGAIVGAVGGGLCLPAVAACDPWLHPLVSSSLAWALAGLLAGLGGYDLAWWLAERAEPTEDDEADERQPRVMWVLRERKRSLRRWPLLRVLPVVAVSAFSLVGAAILAPSDAALALAAVGVLGLAAAAVLHDQEKRLRELEGRVRPVRDV